MSGGQLGQHLIEAAEVPLQFPICAVLREVVNMLISGKVPVQVAWFLAGGNLVALEKNNMRRPEGPHAVSLGKECNTAMMLKSQWRYFFLNA